MQTKPTTFRPAGRNPRSSALRTARARGRADRICASAGGSGFLTVAAATILLLAGLIGAAPSGRPNETKAKATAAAPRKAQPTSAPARPTRRAKPQVPPATAPQGEPGKPTADPRRSAIAARGPSAGRGARLKSNQPSKRNNGSAKVLTGRICLIHLFVEDAGSSWTAKGKRAEGRRMAKALAFLREQGRRYRQTFTFVEETLADVRLKKTIPVDMFHSPWWIEEAIRAAGYKDGPSLIRASKVRHAADHALVMVHVNKQATSYNLTYYRGVHRVFHAERVVMFARYSDGRPTCAASYAHEILHSFGAGELYFPFDDHPRRKRLARRLFPNDVMLRVAYDINALEIGAYTAYRVGWLNRLEAKYKVFED